MGPRGNEKPEQGARRSPRIRVRGSKSSPKGSRASPGIAAKRAKLDLEVRDHDDANFSGSNRSTRRSRFHITSLPTEILVEILSYLSLGDLYALRQVSTFFERLVSDPAVWRAYEVVDNEMNTSDVIDELKRMPFLRKFSIAARSDSDDILRQLSLTNRNLEELHVSNCTGSTSKLYLRSLYLIRILERCGRLHTVNILGTRFRGVKFYRLLADMGLRLRAATAPATGTQFLTFASHARHIRDQDRRLMRSMCTGPRNWALLHYSLLDRRRMAFVSYFYNEFVEVDSKFPV